MPLSVVIGSSGSGKTTFLNDANDLHRCTYIRQYHNVRPYVTVSKIPGFDPTKLPYWELYIRDGKDTTIQAGGSLAGEFTAGLSGGQRKLLLFELICQRTANQSRLLLLLDEPFSGVTEDFVPFIVDRLQVLRKKHNIVIVTNDHIEALTEMADNIVAVSAIDRSTVKINEEMVDRNKALLALSSGSNFECKTSWDDISFFMGIEFFQNSAFVGVILFMVVAFGLYLLAFWNSSEEHMDLIVVAAFFLAFFSMNGWVIGLAEWRIVMEEEADALLHASRTTNKMLKALQTILMVVVISTVGFGMINAVTEGFNEPKFYLAFLLDNLAPILAFVCFGLFTNLNLQDCDIISSLYILLTIFFSSSFSPGGGVRGVTSLRYIFPRFYFWCMLPYVQDKMDGCPADEDKNILYLVLTTFLETVLFLMAKVGYALLASNSSKETEKAHESLKDDQFLELQQKLFGAHSVYNLKKPAKLDTVSMSEEQNY